MILASYPEKQWDDILPELQALQLDPDSLVSMSEEIRSPQPLESLIERLDCDFSVSLLAQCCYLAQRDGVISPVSRRQKVQSPSSEASCGVEFKVGDRYQVYAKRTRGVLSTHLCSGTKPL
jgi:hypothetical protein